MTLTKNLKTTAFAIVAALALTASFGTVSHAQSIDDTPALEDILSPDEILEDMQAQMPVAPDSTEVHALHYAAPRVTDRLHILVDKSQKGTSPTAQSARIYLDGQLIYNWAVSTGRERLETKTKSGRVYFSATPVGTFRIQSRVYDYYSTTWQAHMMHAQFFNGSVALHATVPMHFAALGTRDSGGCVRLHPDNATILWDLVDQVGVANVLVEVIDPGN